MPFINIEGLAGKIFVPEDCRCGKKHPCPDCFQCQFCSDERCELCLKSRRKANSPLSLKKNGE